MATAQPLLSPEEIAALTESMDASEDAAHDTRRPDATVKKHDLASEDSSLGVNVVALDMINERFIRSFRLGMLELLRANPKLSATRVQINRFGDYLYALKPPMSVNTIRMSPLRGHAVVVIEPSVIFSSLDSFFGGFGKGVSQLAPGRLFTPTESRIVNLILSVFFRSMREAWAPITHVEFEHVGSEINPQFAQIADENELVVVSRFESDGGPDAYPGFLDLVIPYVALKPIRDLLRGRVQSGDGDEDSDKVWRMQLEDAVGDSRLELRVVLGALELSLTALREMSAGDVFYFDRYDPARMLVRDTPVFDVEVGSAGQQLACRIADSIKPSSGE